MKDKKGGGALLLDGKVAIVTGGSQGIGRGIVKVFLEQGASVVTCSRNDAKLRKLADEMENETGKRPVVLRADVSQKEDVDAVVARTLELFGTIDILVNNAGVQQFSPFLEMSEQLWDEHFNVNIRGTFLCTQAVGRVMAHNRSGKIVNIASDSGLAPLPDNASAYCASKAAMISLTRNVAKELGPFGVYCNAVCPGAITSTGMMDYFVGCEPQNEQNCIDAAALRRLGRPEEIGNAALFLASGLSDFITGEYILATGGDLMSR